MPIAGSQRVTSALLTTSRTLSLRRRTCCSSLSQAWGKRASFARCARQLPEAGFRLTSCRNASLCRRDFYRLLCHTLGLQPTSTAASLFLDIEAYVADLRRDKVHPVFLLDDAHLLHADMLAHLHLLLNYK